MMRPIYVPNFGKMILNNTCFVDSIISILASSAADSLEFRNYVQSVPITNLTATIIKKCPVKVIIKKYIMTVYYYCYSFFFQIK